MLVKPRFQRFVSHVVWTAGSVRCNPCDNRDVPKLVIDRVLWSRPVRRWTRVSSVSNVRPVRPLRRPRWPFCRTSR